MDLKNVLEKIFNNETDERINDIYDELKRVRCQSKEDLTLLDKDILKDTNLASIEIKKLLSFSSDLEDTLEKIFGNKNRNKLEKIKKYLDEKEVYTTEDLGIFDLDDIDLTIFSQQDILKLKNFIRRELPENYNTIKEKEDDARSKKNIELETSVKSREAREAQKAEYLRSLYDRRKTLDENASAMNRELVGLMIAQTQVQGNSNISSTVSGGALVCSMLSKTAAAIVIGKEMASFGMQVYSEYNRNNTNSSNTQLLKERLVDNKVESKKIDDEINHVLSVGYGEDFSYRLSSVLRKQIEN